jgi:hypothetical protein
LDSPFFFGHIVIYATDHVALCTRSVFYFRTNGVGTGSSHAVHDGGAAGDGDTPISYAHGGAGTGAAAAGDGDTTISYAHGGAGTGAAAAGDGAYGAATAGDGVYGAAAAGDDVYGAAVAGDDVFGYAAAAGNGVYRAAAAGVGVYGARAATATWRRAAGGWVAGHGAATSSGGQAG